MHRNYQSKIRYEKRLNGTHKQYECGVFLKQWQQNFGTNNDKCPR